jgi:hypothetical protein
MKFINQIFYIYISLQGDIENVVGYLNKKQIDSSMIAIHCHDTFGQALANILMAMEVIKNYGFCICKTIKKLFRWELGLLTLVVRV